MVAGLVIKNRQMLPGWPIKTGNGCWPGYQKQAMVTGMAYKTGNGCWPGYQKQLMVAGPSSQSRQRVPGLIIKNRQWLPVWPLRQAMVAGLVIKNRQWLPGWPIKPAIFAGLSYLYRQWVASLGYPKQTMVTGMTYKTDNGCWAILLIKIMGSWLDYQKQAMVTGRADVS